MFARSVLRSAGPLRQSFRTYATEVPAKSGSATPWIIGAAAAGAGYAGYSFLGTQANADTPVPAAEKKTPAAPAPVKKTFTGGDQGFVDLKLKEIKPYNHDTKRFVFELPEADQVSGLNVASAILTKYKAEDQEKPTIRPYTPINDEGVQGELELLIKTYPKGAMSEYIHAMKPGDSLSFKGPLPKYPWSANKHDHITLIAGGTGITPMYQLIRGIFNNPEDKTKVSLIFGNKTEGDVLLKEELEKIEKEFPQRFKAFYTLDQAPKNWPHGKGFVTKELLQEVIPDPKTENIKIFVCGPPPFYKSLSGVKPSPQDQGELSGALKDLGYTKEQVFKF